MSTTLLSDVDHPSIQVKAASLTAARESTMDKLESIFHFVRDEIEFGFTPKWDAVKASEVLTYGIGYCNPKATLFVALCRAAGISARVHCGMISIDIMRGVFPSIAFPFLPTAGGHTWTEVQIEGQWKPIDSYINDKAFFTAAKAENERRGWNIGFSIASPDGQCDCEYNIDPETYVQMPAVIEEHGTWDDPSEYMSTDEYLKMSPLHMFFLKFMVGGANNKIEQMRQRYSEENT